MVNLLRSSLLQRRIVLALTLLTLSFGCASDTAQPSYSLARADSVGRAAAARALQTARIDTLAALLASPISGAGQSVARLISLTSEDSSTLDEGSRRILQRAREELRAQIRPRAIQALRFVPELESFSRAQQMSASGGPSVDVVYPRGAILTAAMSDTLRRIRVYATTAQYWGDSIEWRLWSSLAIDAPQYEAFKRRRNAVSADYVTLFRRRVAAQRKDDEYQECMRFETERQRRHRGC